MVVEFAPHGFPIGHRPGPMTEKTPPGTGIHKSVPCGQAAFLVRLCSADCHRLRGHRFIPAPIRPRPRETAGCILPSPATHSLRHDRFEENTLFVPIENRPLLGVDEVEALTGVPAKIIRANVRNGLLKACMAGSTTMRIRRRDLDEWLDTLPAWRA